MTSGASGAVFARVINKVAFFTSMACGVFIFLFLEKI